MIDENTAHIRNTDFKGSFMSELDLKNGEKTFYKIQTGLKSYVDCEVSLSDLFLRSNGYVERDFHCLAKTGPWTVYFQGFWKS